MWTELKAPYSCFKSINFECENWFSQMSKCWTNDTYFVGSRYIAEYKVEHIAICRKDGNIVTWSEKQKIKDELFGKDRTAIEIYPPSNELIDDGNVYHLWVYKRGYKFPFSFM